MSQGTLSQLLDWFLSFSFYALVKVSNLEIQRLFRRQMMTGSFLH